MSGVFAYFSPADTRIPQVCDAMSGRLQVTPQVSTSWTRLLPTAGVGVASLGVHQWETVAPVTSPDSEIALWLIGEFFHCGSQVAAVERGLGHPLHGDQAKFALEVYLKEGPHGLAALSGTFLVAVWDSRSGDLALINDRSGFYPHYIYHRDQTLVVAPSLTAILAAPDVPASPDAVAVAQFTRFQQMLGRRTWVRDVSLMLPATVVRFNCRAGRLATYRHWDWDRLRPYGRINRADALEECSRLFESAVAARTEASRTALLLSGGLDSRTILAFTRDPAHQLTLTYGTAGSLDVEIAGQVARASGSPHEWEPYVDGRWVCANADRYFALTEGAQSIIHSHGLSTMAAARTRADVLLTGWGGGTVIGGYLDSYDWDARYRSITEEDALTRAMYEAFCLRLTWPGLTDDEAAVITRSTFGRPLCDLAFESFREEFAQTRHYDPAVRLDGFYVDQHERRGTLNMHVMARGYLEARAPFKDEALGSFFFALPEDVRRSPWMIRAVLHGRSPVLAAISYEKDGLPPHPSQMIRRAHRGVRRASGAWQRLRGFGPRTRLYADYEHYLRTDLRAWAEELLLGDRTRVRGWFDRAAVEALWERHVSGRELWTVGKIMPLITIEQVMRRLFDGTPHESDSASPSIAMLR